MMNVFLITLRESLQCSLLLLVVLYYLKAEGATLRFNQAFAGTGLALAAGFSLGYFSPLFASAMPTNETWTFLRHTTEVTLFYTGLALACIRTSERGDPVAAGLFAIGFWAFFFEARALGFILLDTGQMQEATYMVLGAGAAGTAIGFIALVPARRLLDKFKSVPRSLSASTLLILLGAMKFASGGVGELEARKLFVAMQGGVAGFLEVMVAKLQYGLLISGHQFIEAPLQGLAAYLGGERTALALVVAFVAVPPIYALVRTFAQPEPSVDEIIVPARRRLSIALFRRDIIFRSIPPLLSLIIVIVLLHAVSVSLNPMTEPAPITVREVQEEGVLRIPVADAMGDLSDGKLRKYVYFWGSMRINIIAILKPDGSVGVALDECEICKPAEWNKSAQGYAQRGDNLVCKYCMTPIPTSSVNNPGGCNPIPLPFKAGAEEIVIELDDLIRVFKIMRDMQKEGTHL